MAGAVAGSMTTSVVAVLSKLGLSLGDVGEKVIGERMKEVTVAGGGGGGGLQWF